MTDTLDSKVATAIADIWNVYIRETLVTFNSQEITGEEVAAMMQSAPFFVAVAGEAVLGFATYSDFRKGVGYARSKEHTIMIAQGKTRGGVGRGLLDAVVSHARDAGVHSLFAGISGDNLGAIDFHAAQGFMQVARIADAGWKFDRYHDLVLMQKFL